MLRTSFPLAHVVHYLPEGRLCASALQRAMDSRLVLLGVEFAEYKTGLAGYGAYS